MPPKTYTTSSVSNNVAVCPVLAHGKSEDPPDPTAATCCHFNSFSFPPMSDKSNLETVIIIFFSKILVLLLLLLLSLFVFVVTNSASSSLFVPMPRNK